MSKEDLKALVKEKVSDQGNQGATNLAEVLYAIIDASGEGGGTGVIPLSEEVPETGFKPGILYEFAIDPHSRPPHFEGNIVLDDSEVPEGSVGQWHFLMNCVSGLPTWPASVSSFIYQGAASQVAPELDMEMTYEVSILGGICCITAVTEPRN